MYCLTIPKGMVKMRIKEIWDDWMEYDEDGFYSGIREDAPDEVKEAYKTYLAEKENISGYIVK